MNIKEAMEVVTTLLSLVHDCLMQPAIRHTGYALHVITEIEKLRDEMEKLIAVEEDVGRNSRLHKIHLVVFQYAAQRKKLKRSGTIFKDGVEMLPFLSQFSIEVQAWEKRG